jgi:hypothetical protein
MPKRSLQGSIGRFDRYLQLELQSALAPLGAPRFKNDVVRFDHGHVERRAGPLLEPVMASVRN